MVGVTEAFTATALANACVSGVIGSGINAGLDKSLSLAQNLAKAGNAREPHLLVAMRETFLQSLKVTRDEMQGASQTWHDSAQFHKVRDFINSKELRKADFEHEAISVEMLDERVKSIYAQSGPSKMEAANAALIAILETAIGEDLRPALRKVIEEGTPKVPPWANLYELLFARRMMKDNDLYVMFSVERQNEIRALCESNAELLDRIWEDLAGKIDGLDQKLDGIDAKIEALAAEIAKTNPDQAKSFAEAAEKLAQSDDQDDRETARIVAEGQLEKGADQLMRDAREGKRRNAERFRQAARIYAPAAPSKAKEAYEEAVQLDPTDVWSWIELGRLRMHYDSLDSAELCFKNALQRVSSDAERSVLHDEFGSLLVTRGELPKAREEYEAALAIDEARAKAEPSDFSKQKYLSVSYNRLGDVEVAAGSLAAARERYEAGLAVTDRLAQEEPVNTEWQRDLSVSYMKLGDVEVAAGSLAAARERYEASLVIADRLVQQEPDNAEWQRDLSVSYDRLGNVEGAAGNLAAARERFEAGLVIRDRLAQQEPGNAGWQRDLSVSYIKLGDVEREAGNLTAARERYEAALAIADRLAKQEPGNAGWQRDLSVSYNKLGDVEVEADNIATARERYEAGLAIRDRLAQEEPGNAQWQRDLSLSYERLGDLALFHSDPAEPELALERYRQASETRWKIARANPDFGQFWAELALPLSRRGSALVANEDEEGLVALLVEYAELAAHWQSKKFDPDTRVNPILAVLANLERQHTDSEDAGEGENDEA